MSAGHVQLLPIRTPCCVHSRIRAPTQSSTFGKASATNPESGTASPLSTDELLAVFGTTTPRTEQVQQWMKNPRGMTHRGNWIATYVISYRDGEADHIHFFGFSGD
jgi:hypothetical protein